MAYRRVSRLSSPLTAKAFTKRPFRAWFDPEKARPAKAFKSVSNHVWTDTLCWLNSYWNKSHTISHACHWFVSRHLVSVLDLDNTFFSGGIHEEDRGNSLRSCLPIFKVLIARKLMVTRLEPHRDPNPNADGSNSVDIVSLFTMSIRLRTDDQTHGVCLMMCPIVCVCVLVHSSEWWYPIDH